MMAQRNKKNDSFKALMLKMKSWKTAASLTEGFLGAHRYTTGGGMCVLRRPLHGALARRDNGSCASQRQKAGVIGDG